ncbi:hypothetical protein [Nostoc sp.]|uniref:hypothetical protein n=1 Tax=Nostoc sp. TaxID=1180 RepID=UPI002FF7539E
MSSDLAALRRCRARTALTNVPRVTSSINVILSLHLLGLGKLPDVESLDFLVSSVAYSWFNHECVSHLTSFYFS